MKKLILYSFLLVGLLASSCNESMERQEDLSGETANADLYLETFGFQTANTVSQIYDDFEYSLNLNYKGTSDLTVSLVVDSTILTDYNSLYETSYKVLPNTYFTLGEQVVLTNGSTTIPVNLHTKAMFDEFGIEGVSEYIIPLKVQAENDTVIVNSTLCEALLHMSMSDPTVMIETPSSAASFDDTTGVAMLSLNGRFNFDGLDASNLAVAINEESVATYNSANGTDYPLLPAEFTELVVDSAARSLRFNFELNTLDLEKISYLLPVDVSSDAYMVDPESTVYYVVSIENTVPEFIGIFNHSTIQQPTIDYSATQIQLDMATAASLFDTTEEELEGNIVLYAVQPDGTFATDYTANPPGFWMDENGYACGWGAEGCALYAEYVGEGVLNIGQFPEAASGGEAYNVSFALVYNNQMIRYNVTLNVLVATYDISVTEPVDNDYVATQLEFDIYAAADDFGVSLSELQNNIAFRAQNTDGEIISGYTANNGFWFTDTGNVCSWGEEGCAIYVEYDNNTSFNVGQYPGLSSPGDQYHYTMFMVYNDTSFIQYNITVNIQ